MMTAYFKLGASALAMSLAAGTAQAGGVVAPVVEPAPIAVAPAPVVAPWAGGYVGGSLGYVFGTEDEVGVRVTDGDDLLGEDNGLGDLGISGLTAGLHAGYRWQRGNWVFGPELGVEFGSVDESREITPFGVTATVENELNHLVSLVAKTGYLVNPQTLVYGTFGVAHGDYEYSFEADGDRISEDFTTTGIAAGLGVERMVSDRLSVFGEYQYRDFGNEDIMFGDTDPSIGTTASMSQSTIKVGANWRF